MFSGLCHICCVSWASTPTSKAQTSQALQLRHPAQFSTQTNCLSQACAVPEAKSMEAAGTGLGWRHGREKEGNETHWSAEHQWFHQISACELGPLSCIFCFQPCSEVKISSLYLSGSWHSPWVVPLGHLSAAGCFQGKPCGTWHWLCNIPEMECGQCGHSDHRNIHVQSWSIGQSCPFPPACLMLLMYSNSCFHRTRFLS